MHEANLSAHGVRKVWHQLRREDIAVGRDRVGRLMGGLGLCGATRSRRVRTTIPAVVATRPDDLVERMFSAPAPDRLWVADLTYVWTRSGLCYASFVIDAFSRRVLGWRVSPSPRTDLALDAPGMAIFTRGDRDLAGLAHHGDRGTQCLAIRCSERPAEAGAVASAGSRGDSHDDAPAETVNGLHEAELIHRAGPWRSVADVGLATSRWVHWRDTQRLHGACGDVPPAEHEGGRLGHPSGDSGRLNPIVRVSIRTSAVHIGDFARSEVSRDAGAAVAPLDRGRLGQNGVVSTRAREIAVIGFVAGMALGLFIGTNADPRPRGRAAAPALASSPSPSTDNQTLTGTPASKPDPASNLLSGLVGALVGGGLAYIGALHIQRRDFDKKGRDAARAVFYELILNRSTVSLSRATGMLMPPAMSRATYDQALLVLSGALPADEMNPLVLAYVDVSMTLAQYKTGEALSADAAAKFEGAEKDMTVAIDILAKYFDDDEKLRLMGEIRAQQSGLRQPGQITLEIMDRLRAEGPKSYVDENVEHVVSAADQELQVGEADNPTRLRAFVDERGTVTVHDHAEVAEIGTLFRSLASELALAGTSGYTPTIAVVPSVPVNDETVGRANQTET